MINATSNRETAHSSRDKDLDPLIPRVEPLVLAERRLEARLGAQTVCVCGLRGACQFPVSGVPGSGVPSSSPLAMVRAPGKLVHITSPQ